MKLLTLIAALALPCGCSKAPLKYGTTNIAYTDPAYTDTNNYSIVTDGTRFKIKLPSGNIAFTTFDTKNHAAASIASMAETYKQRIRDEQTQWKPAP